MAASEMAFGDEHPATYINQSASSYERAQLSGEAFGDGEDHGFVVKRSPEPHSFHHGHDSDD
ncbi:hypothetical protein RAAC3_TM7C00001G0825 [Candidatus Saccharibacteria bacterium RAAC3_TM7_1]|nr:hypothetical protein RAAC3_TM7C00001G0825 [Candidatus Saccharibacteria bacterium RAAC3_TM7_1]